MKKEAVTQEMVHMRNDPMDAKELREERDRVMQQMEKNRTFMVTMQFAEISGSKLGKKTLIRIEFRDINNAILPDTLHEVEKEMKGLGYDLSGIYAYSGLRLVFEREK
jgi:hypothetical protein